MLRRFSVFLLSFLLCLSLFPVRAFASWSSSGSASVLWSGFVNDGAQYGAFVKGGSNFDAAVAALGYDSSRLSDEVKTKLADANYSGFFYTFAISFESVSTPFDIPSWVPLFVTTGAVVGDLWNNISGSNYPHWSVEVVSSLYDLALRDFLVVLNGGDLSGGGSGGNPDSNIPSSLTFNHDNYVGAARYDGWFTNTSYTSKVDLLVGGTIDISAIRSTISSYASSYPYVTYLIEPTSNGGFYNNCRVYLTLQVFFTSSEPIVSAGNTITFPSGYRSTNSVSLSPRVTQNSDSLELVASGAVFNVGNPNSSSYTKRVDSIVCYHLGNYISSTPSPPSGVWPDPVTPAAPVAPELPEPAEPVVETPVSPSVSAPSWPDITINIDVDPTPGTTPSGLDYTELLTRINDNLISVDSFVHAINSNLNSLRGDLLSEFNGVIDSLRNIFNYLLTIDSVLETHCTHLRNKIEETVVFIANYMRSLIKWLADQLDYDDLTNVGSPDNEILSTINDKLGGGTYEPNPIKDEQGYYEWLDDLWDRFLLGDNWQSSMGSILGSFSQLTTRFPFSLPWDIVALFRLFVHDPVTPVFDLPLYFSADGSTPVRVDLSPWDSVASIVRPMVFVIFALKLALLSRDLLGGLGADKGGL